MPKAATTIKRDAGAADFDDIDVMLGDWKRHLQAANRAPSTIQSYLTVGERFAASCGPKRCRRRSRTSPGPMSRRGWCT